MHKDPKEYFMDKLEEDIREIEEQLDVLETKLEDAGWEPEMDFRNQIDSLRLRLENLMKEVDRFEVSSESKWSVFKKSCENTLSKISKDTQEITSRMNNFLLE